VKSNLYIMQPSVNGMKALSLPRALQIWQQQRWGQENETTESVYKSVAWIYRATKILADGVSRLPFELLPLDGDEPLEENEFPVDIDWRQLLWQTVAARCLHGAAYWLKNTNVHNVLKGLQYLNYNTMRVIADPRQGITGFEQSLPKGKPITYPVSRIVYLPLWTPDNDVHPGVSPAQVALTAAGLGKHANEYIRAFFKNGAIPAIILKTEEQSVPDKEVKRLKAWWNKLFQGHDKAFGTGILTKGMEIEQLTAVNKDLVIPELQEEVRRQIAAAFGIPQTIMEDAANYATARAHFVQLYTQAIFPEAEMVANFMNRQFWKDFGLKWRFRTEDVEAMQQEESEKAREYSLLYEVGLIGQEEARVRLDFDETVPSDLKPQEAMGGQQSRLARGLNRDVSPYTGAIRADLSKWRKVALKAIRAGKPQREFESNEIPIELHEEIATALAAAKSEGDVKEIFQRPFDRAAVKAAPSRAGEDVLERIILKILSDYWGLSVAAIRRGGVPPLTALGAALEQALEVSLTEMATDYAIEAAVAVGVDFDVALINVAAAEWAEGYSYELVGGLVDTTRKVVSKATRLFVETPGMTIGELRDLLKPAFGPARAQMIAVTETTRAYSAATNIYQRMLAAQGLDMVRVWNTAADERVCPICGPLEGQPESVWAGRFPAGPPCHTNCRCWTTLTLQPKRAAEGRWVQTAGVYP